MDIATETPQTAGERSVREIPVGFGALVVCGKLGRWPLSILARQIECDRLYIWLKLCQQPANALSEVETVKDAIQPQRTSFRSPWQNGVAERWIGSCRRDLIDHAIVVNERHLRRLMNEYLSYYHEDRTHLALDKRTPSGRAAVRFADSSRRVVSMPRLGRLHHRYYLAA
jgi:hypothetical protein